MFDKVFSGEVGLQTASGNTLQNVNDLLDILADESEEKLSNNIGFLKEQLNLMFSKKMNCATTLIWFATLFFSFPAAYKSIRFTTRLTMPHPRYLQRFTTKLGMGSSGIDESHINYLKKNVSYLKPHERICNLLIDEVYVKAELSYKGGKWEGIAKSNHVESDTNLATTVQAFIISSVFCKNKDVVGLLEC